MPRAGSEVMAMKQDRMAVQADEVLLTLDELCRATEVGPDWVSARVQAGLLAAHRVDAAAWQFDDAAR